jgi:predicted DNA-binding protein
MSKKQDETEPVKIRLSTTVKNQLQKLSDENERTLAGQIRLALNEWIENKSRGARK